MSGSNLLINPPSPGRLPATSTPVGYTPVSSSPVSAISRTGLVSPGTAINPVNPSSYLSNVSPSSTMVAPLSPRLTSTTGSVRPPLIGLGSQPSAVTYPSQQSPTSVRQLVTPVQRTPIVITPSRSVISPGPLNQISGFSSTSRVATPVLTGTPVATPLSLTPGTDLVSTEKTMEEMLADKGYIVIDTIFVRTAGDMTAKYVKAKNNYGQTVFIELDQEGVVYETDNQTMIVSQEASMVPNSTQIGVYECAKSGGACGVAFECEGEICTLTKSVDSPDQPTRLVLTTASKPVEKSLTVSGSPTAYPVIRFSDVMSGNPILLIEFITASIRNINNAGDKECLKNLEENRKAMVENMEAANEFSIEADMKLKRLAADLSLLRGYRRSFEINPPVTEAEKIKFQNIVNNIDNRQELLTVMFAICQVIPSSTQVIRQQTESLKESIKNMRNLFSDLGTVVEKKSVPVLSQTI